MSAAPADDRLITLEERQGIVRLELALPAIDLAALDLIEPAIARIEDAAGRGEIRGLIITGGARGLPGGPDPSLFLDSEDGETIRRFAARGNELARRIERLPIPVVAILGGRSLDAGLELALAAHQRIARLGAGLKIGLPGPDAALPPLFGGLGRLIEVCGLRHGLELVLERRRIGGRRALEIGLVAELAPAAQATTRAEARIEELAAAWRSGRPGRPARKNLGLTDYLQDQAAFFRRLELGRFRRRLRELERPPALAARLLDDLESRFALPRFEQLERESAAAAAVADRLDTRRRLSLMRRGDDRLRGGPYAPAGATVTLPRRVAILGAGHVGRRLALALLGRGMRVALFDPFAEALVAARNQVDDALDDMVARGRLRPAAARRVHDRFFLAPEPRDLRDVDLVIECVPEVLALKQEVLRRAAELSAETTLLCSHSASYSPDELRRGLAAERRVQVMHLPVPEESSGLCEILRARDARHDELAVLVRVAHEIGRFPLISCGQAPNASGRLLCSFVAAALQLFDEGYSPRTIDHAAHEFGFALGPLELLDRVGLDVVLAMARKLAEDPRAGFRAPEALVTLVERGETGRRRGIGIRVWTERGSTLRNESELRQICGMPATMLDQDGTRILRRLIDPLVFTGRLLLDGRMIDGPSELDLLSVHGLGFPAARGGLAHYAEEIA
ncbi:MAG: hypothetical protein H6807_16195 [Planctomycetes bacterium]|nr:hypothetical protein [Planctomycetota bacterium]